MTKLANKIININNRRTSMRLCSKEWEALEEVCRWENISKNQLIELIENAKSEQLGLAYSTRLFLMLYYRDSAHPPKPAGYNKSVVSQTVIRIIKEIE